MNRIGPTDRTKAYVWGPGPVRVEPQDGGFAAPEIVVAGASLNAEIQDIAIGEARRRVGQTVALPGNWLCCLVRVS